MLSSMYIHQSLRNYVPLCLHLYSFLPCTFIHVVWFQTLLSALLVFQITLNSHIDFFDKCNSICGNKLFARYILIIQNKSIFINYNEKARKLTFTVIYYSLIQQYHLKDFNSILPFYYFYPLIMSLSQKQPPDFCDNNSQLLPNSLCCCCC